MTTPATAAIKNEVAELTQVQIETFVRPSVLTSSELSEYRRRSERLRLLFEELDRINTKAFFKEHGRIAT
jgi:hypothetical protein